MYYTSTVYMMGMSLVLHEHCVHDGDVIMYYTSTVHDGDVIMYYTSTVYMMGMSLCTTRALCT